MFFVSANKLAVTKPEPERVTAKIATSAHKCADVVKDRLCVNKFTDSTNQEAAHGESLPDGIRTASGKDKRTTRHTAER